MRPLSAPTVLRVSFHGACRPQPHAFEWNEAEGLPRSDSCSKGPPGDWVSSCAPSESEGQTFWKACDDLELWSLEGQRGVG